VRVDVTRTLASLLLEARMVAIPRRRSRSVRSFEPAPLPLTAASGGEGVGGAMAAALPADDVPERVLFEAGGVLAYPGPVQIQVSPSRVARAFGGFVALLVVTHVLVQIVGHALHDEQVLGLLPLFNVGTERNLPTFYSACAMLVCSGLLLLITWLEWERPRAKGLYWAVLAAVFCALACDEMLVLHEKLIAPVRDLLGTSGALYYAWVIPYGAFALLFACVYARFLWQLPRRSALLFLLAGAVFVSGALGLEMLGASWIQRYGRGPGYVAFQTVEETFEMGGIVLFVFALLDYIGREHEVRVRFGAD